MRSWTTTLLAASTLCALTGSYALAAGDRGPSNGNGWANGWSKNGKATPGPIAGAGLPFLLIAGGYVLVRRYRNRGKAE